MRAFLTTLVLLSVSSISSANTQTAFDNSKYLKECGGRVYSKCDKPELSQETIYNEAKQLALSSKRLLLINIGADWCAPCIIIDASFKADPAEAAKINEKFVIAKMNGDTDSFKKLKSANQWPGEGFPQMVAIDPRNNNALTSFFPALLNSVGEIRQELGKRLANASKPLPAVKQYKWFPEKDIELAQTLKIRLELLKRPIALDPKATVPNVQATTSNKEALAYYSQGMFYLHSFHWVDATRSFRKAIEIDPKFYSAYLGITKSLQELGALDGEDRALNPLMVARSVKSALPRKEAELAFARYLEIDLCSQGQEACKLFEIVLQGEAWGERSKVGQEVIEVAKKEENADVMSLVAQGIGNVEALDDVIKFNPNHLAPHHYQIHNKENVNEYKQAVEHAEKFAQLAPQVAHSHHMYGHVLPKVGKWRQAVKVFEQADVIHKKWFVLNQANPWEDWHYEHNLNLLAHASFFGGDQKNAEMYWKRRCEDLKRLPCEEYFKYLILVGRSQEAEKLVKLYWTEPAKKQGGIAKASFDMLSTEVLGFAKLSRAKTTGEAKAIIAELSKTPHFRTDPPEEENETIRRLKMVANFGGSKAESDALSSDLTQELSQGGFDSWSEAMFETDYLARLAGKLGHKNLAANIELTKAAVGFRCK